MVGVGFTSCDNKTKYNSNYTNTNKTPYEILKDKFLSEADPYVLDYKLEGTYLHAFDENGNLHSGVKKTKNGYKNTSHHIMRQDITRLIHYSNNGDAKYVMWCNKKGGVIMGALLNKDGTVFKYLKHIDIGNARINIWYDNNGTPISAD